MPIYRFLRVDKSGSRFATPPNQPPVMMNVSLPNALLRRTLASVAICLSLFVSNASGQLVLLETFDDTTRIDSAVQFPGWALRKASTACPTCLVDAVTGVWRQDVSRSFQGEACVSADIPGEAVDAYLFSPNIALTKGLKYTITFRIATPPRSALSGPYSNDTLSFQFFIAEQQSINSFQLGPVTYGNYNTYDFIPALPPPPNQWQELEFTFTPTLTRNYVLGFRKFCADSTLPLFLDTVAVFGPNGPCVSVVDAGSESIEICEGDSVRLSALGTFPNPPTWETATPQSAYDIDVDSADAGVIYVNAVDSTGCPSQDSIRLVVTPTPVANLAASGETSFCAPGQLTMQGSGGNTYTWLKDGFPLAGAPSVPFVTVDRSGGYSIIAETANGCRDTADTVIQVTVFPQPLPVVRGFPSAVCNGEPAVLFFDANVDVDRSNWIKDGIGVTGGIFDTLVTDSTGGYTVRVRSTDGCDGRSVDTFRLVTSSQAIVASFQIDPTGTPGVFDFTGTSTGAVDAEFLIPALDTLLRGSSATFSFPALGDYEILHRVMSDSGCADTATEVLQVTVGLASERDVLAFEAYPNPTNGEVNLQLPTGLDRVRVSLLDLNGRELLMGELQRGQPLQLQDTPAGLYVLKVQGEGRVGHTRLLVQ